MSDWIEWPGGECPVAQDALIDIRLRNGDEMLSVPAGKWIWKTPRVEAMTATLAGTFYNGGMVVAYRESEVAV